MRNAVFCHVLLISFSGNRAAIPLQAQRTSIETHRVIRQECAMNKCDSKAFQCGTRRFSGTPGPIIGSWKTDFTINAKFGSSTQTITGSEKILVHNSSPEWSGSNCASIGSQCISRGCAEKELKTTEKYGWNDRNPPIKVDGKSVDLKMLLQEEEMILRL